MADSASELYRPRPTLTVFDGVCVVVGIVVGVGIFKAPSIVAANVASQWEFMALWGLGAMISLIGALCYAELSAAYPNVGGEYHFLKRAFGWRVGFLFAWGRLSVVQTGAIAVVAFVVGDYASQLAPIGPYGSAIYAGLAIVGLTLLNLRGVSHSKWLQNILTVALIIAVAGIIVVSLTMAPIRFEVSAAALPEGSNASGLALIFVLLTFGGWNEAVYLAGEVRNVQRTMVRLLVIGLGVVAVVYLLLNFAYLQVLGLDGMRESEVVAADLLRATMGERGALIISMVIAGAALTTLNATIFTGARTSYAFGRDFPLFGWLGRWDSKAMTPSNALLVQGVIALMLVILGALGRKGFATIVEYTAPVFWLFFLLSALSLFVLRQREPEIPRLFRVPFYPFTPALFCITCAYMLHASIAYTGIGALVGGVVLLGGLPLMYLSQRRLAAKKMASNV
ncbi:MAG TPA: amino acid permease [Burkholderiales bacterium]|nr:amino acid permease [Burkholderiales bacterium]